MSTKIFAFSVSPNLKKIYKSKHFHQPKNVMDLIKVEEGKIEGVEEEEVEVVVAEEDNSIIDYSYLSI